MHNKIFGFLLLCIITIQSCTSEKKYFNAPVIDFFHIDINVDSADFEKLKENDFLKNEFGSVFIDTSQIQGKPSYEIYLLGQETFLHINLAKGYWENRAGGGALIFQSRFPDKFDSLIMAWQQFYPDSLYRNNVKSTAGDDVGEVAIYHKIDTLVPRKPTFYPVLLTFSRSSFHSWGFSDSAIAEGVTMRQFMDSWDSTLPQKLFKKINAMHLQITENETKELETAMKTIGYRKEGNSFVHKFNPPVYYQVTKENRIPRFAKIEIELSRPVEGKTFDFGSFYHVELSGTKMTMTAKQ